MIRKPFLESVIEELNAMREYHEATSDDYSFLYVNLMNKDKRKMLLERFQKYLIPECIIFHINI